MKKSWPVGQGQRLVLLQHTPDSVNWKMGKLITCC